jgi:hypothetical protein
MMNAWTIITVMLALLGPLLWPTALMTGYLALRRANRPGRPGDSRAAARSALRHAVPILVPLGVLLVAVAVII